MKAAAQEKESTRLRIAWFCFYPVHVLRQQLTWARIRTQGHACSWIVNLASGLGAVSGVDLHLITLCPWIDKNQSVEIGGNYTLHVLKSGVPYIHRGYPGYIPLDAWMGYCFERRALVNKIRELAPALVHAHGTEYAYGLAAMEAAFPWLVSLQGIINHYLKSNPTLVYRLVAPLERKVLREARYIGGRTHVDMGYASEVNPGAQILELPEAFNTLFYAEPWRDPGNQRILFVGGMEQRKGLHHLIQACGTLVETHPNLRVDVVGAGSPVQLRLLMDMAKKWRVDIVFHGYLAAERIADLHRQCRMFVIPSENENSPNALGEAMASGMPCVAFDVGGISSMMEHEKSGLLVPFPDVKRLAGAIDRLLRSSDLCSKLGANARARAEINRPERVAAVTLAAYKRIIAEW